MRLKGFTLLELIIVIIILGVLATLGVQQYGKMVERSKGAEARQVMGTMRTNAYAFYMETQNLQAVVPARLTDDRMGLCTAAMATDCIPSTAIGCRPSHYFSYSYILSAPALMTITATRCIGGAGKLPSGPAALTLRLSVDTANGIDSWDGDGGY